MGAFYSPFDHEAKARQNCQVYYKRPKAIILWSTPIILMYKNPIAGNCEDAANKKHNIQVGFDALNEKIETKPYDDPVDDIN